MLQQTPASRAASAFLSFLELFPSVERLAAAPRAEVIRAWGGLGYPRRALALSAAAREIVERYGGRIPRDPDVLRGLPGVGPYTAAAVAGFAFGAAVPAIDVNVARVVARARLGRDAHEVRASQIRGVAEAWPGRAAEGARPAEWNQAVMDLGREVCRPVPLCEECPLQGGCRFRRAGRSPSHAPRRQARFEGSARQVRGAVLRSLRNGGGGATVAALVVVTGFPRRCVVDAVASLAQDGLVRAGAAALAGRPRGRVSLPTG